MMRWLPALVVLGVLGACSTNEEKKAPSIDAPPVQQPVCGDGVCEPPEIHSCVADCGAHDAVCGNGVCEAGETSASCAHDCTVCGNGVCETGETTATCPGDCPPAVQCGDGFCDAANGESSLTCPIDCPTMNLDCSDPSIINECMLCLFDGICIGVDPGSCFTCLTGPCNDDGICDPGENALSCEFDCP